MKQRSDEGFVRADVIDLKKMDEQLSRLYSRAWKLHNIVMPDKEEWELEPNCSLVVKQVIGRGTFSCVHRGLYDGQQVAGSNVTVKVFDCGEETERTKAKIASCRAAFKQEASVWHKLDHPNITKFIGATMGMSKINIQSDEIGLASNKCCVVVEYLPGGTLKNYLIKNRKRKLAFKMVIQLALDLARGLRYLHSKKIVHRDIKTENLLLDKNHTLKIADFGIARVEALFPNEMTGATGTLAYMAPEVINNEPYNYKCDVYSFGISLWEIYCCDMPYSNVNFFELTSAVVDQMLRPEIPKNCPESLAQVMRRCWDVDPKKRPEMEEVVSMLEAIDRPHGCFCLRPTKH